MKQALSIALATFVSFPALAADLGIIPKAPPYAQNMVNWGGLYFGGQVGGEFSAKPLSGHLDGPIAALGDPGDFGPNATGYMGGLHIGLNYQFAGPLVLGGELGGNLSSLNTNGMLIAPTTMSITSTVSKPWDVYFIGKLGFAAGPRKEFLLYGLGGGDCAELSNDTTMVSAAGFISKLTANNVHCGWTAGLGVDWKPLGDHFAIGPRYRYTNYGTHGVTFNGGEVGAFRADQHGAVNEITLRGSLFLN